MGKKHFCFFQTAKGGNRAPNSGVKGSGANHYPRAPDHAKDLCTSELGPLRYIGAIEVLLIEPEAYKQAAFNPCGAGTVYMVSNILKININITSIKQFLVDD